VNFECVEPLGKGGMGEVALYKDIESRDPSLYVTTKIEKKAGGSHMKNEATFYDKFAYKTGEKIGGQRKRLVCVPRFIGSGKLADGRAYLITEFVEGG
jgi:hypothetical protein